MSGPGNATGGCQPANPSGVDFCTVDYTYCADIELSPAEMDTAASVTCATQCRRFAC